MHQLSFLLLVTESFVTMISGFYCDQLCFRASTVQSSSTSFVK